MSAKRIRPFEIGAKYRPDQPRVPAGHPDGGQWTDAGGGGGSFGGGRSSTGAGEVQLAQARGRGTVRAGGYAFEATPAQIIRLTTATSAANVAVARVREIDPNWRPRPGVYESAEGAIAHQRGIEAEANARFNELRRDAVPGTSHNWGVNRLTKELYHQGYRFVGPTDAAGNLYRNEAGAEVRIMQRPKHTFRSDSFQKHQNQYYYRYRSGRDQKWKSHTTIPDK